MRGAYTRGMTKTKVEFDQLTAEAIGLVGAMEAKSLREAGVEVPRKMVLCKGARALIRLVAKGRGLDWSDARVRRQAYKEVERGYRANRFGVR